jgi:hypothetical protein
MSIRLSLALSFVVCGLVACTSNAAPESEEAPAADTASALELVQCRNDDARVSCFDGYASNGQRCHTSRDCEEGTVCRGADSRYGGGHCFYVAREPDRDPRSCPRGSVGGIVLCAPGFEQTVISREPHCETCEAGADIARRCRAAGLTAARCRALLNDNRTDGTNLAHRCRAAGLTPTECRRLVSDDPDRDDSPVRGDLDGDRRVDERDVRAFEPQRGPVRGATRADVNGDRVVDEADLRIPMRVALSMKRESSVTSTTFGVTSSGAVTAVVSVLPSCTWMPTWFFWIRQLATTPVAALNAMPIRLSLTSVARMTTDAPVPCCPRSSSR